MRGAAPGYRRQNAEKGLELRVRNLHGVER